MAAKTEVTAIAGAVVVVVCAGRRIREEEIRRAKPVNASAELRRVAFVGRGTTLKGIRHVVGQTHARLITGVGIVANTIKQLITARRVNRGDRMRANTRDAHVVGAVVGVVGASSAVLDEPIRFAARKPSKACFLRIAFPGGSATHCCDRFPVWQASSRIATGVGVVAYGVIWIAARGSHNRRVAAKTGVTAIAGALVPVVRAEGPIRFKNIQGAEAVRTATRLGRVALIRRRSAFSACRLKIG